MWIVVDALRAGNLSCYGYNRETSPNVDALARDGALFESQYSQEFWTFPSVPSYMSGRYFPADCLDLGDWRDQGRAPAPDERFMPFIMRENGYRTCFVHHHHTMVTPYCSFLKGFDKTVEADMDSADNDDAHGVDQAIDDLLSISDSRPFFFYVHLMEVHDRLRLDPPFNKWVNDANVDEKLVGKYPPSLFPGMLTQADKQYLQGVYDGSILSGDAAIGRIMDVLRKHNAFDNTIILVGADHGEALGEDGKSIGHQIVCDEVHHVPLIMRGPGIPSGVRIHEMTENVDIAPTLADLVHLRTDAVFDGRDLAPWFNGGSSGVRPRDFVLAKSSSYNDTHVQLIALVLRDSKYAYSYDPANDVGELFSVPYRGAERKDLSGQFPDVAASMKKRLVDELKPKWRAYMDRPQALPYSPFLVKTRGCDIEPQDAVIQRPDDSPDSHIELPRDKWLSVCGSTELFGNELLGRGGAELQPIKIRYQIPDGAYRIHMLVRLDAWWPFVSSRFRMKAQGDAEFKEIEIKGKETLADFGRYEVHGGVFEMTLGPVQTRHEFHMGKILFVPEAVVETPGSLKDKYDTEQKMKALGYL
jgi:arylsulfatase A-like enzyme